MNVIGKQIRCQQGSLLIEALLSVVILAVTLTLIIRALVTSFRATVFSRDYSQAVFLIDNKMFELLSQRTIDAGLQEQDAFEPPYENFRYNIEANSLADVESDLLHEIQMDILWKTGVKERQISVATYLFDKDLMENSP